MSALTLYKNILKGEFIMDYFELCHASEKPNNITSMVIRDLKSKIEHGFGTKEDVKAYNIFNCDLVIIMAYQGGWWLETHSQYTYIPNYFYKWAKKFLLKNYNITHWREKEV